MGKNSGKVSRFVYRLFFTRDDDLDVLQLLFTAIIVVTLIVVWKVASDSYSESVQREALITLRWLAGLLVATAVPKWMVPTAIETLKTNKADSGASSGRGGHGNRFDEPYSVEEPPDVLKDRD